jgi:hypothetical protein
MMSPKIRSTFVGRTRNLATSNLMLLPLGILFACAMGLFAFGVASGAADLMFRLFIATGAVWALAKARSYPPKHPTPERREQTTRSLPVRISPTALFLATVALLGSAYLLLYFLDMTS